MEEAPNPMTNPFPMPPSKYHKRAITLHDKTADDDKFKKTAEEMFEMKMQLKYGSPLVSAAMEWGHTTDWVTTMRPDGAGVIKKTQKFS